MTDKISLPKVSFKNNQVIEGEEFLELYPDYFRNYGTSRVMIKDEDLGIEKEKFYDYDFVVSKEEVGLIQRYYCNKDEAWKVSVIITAGTEVEFIMKSKIAASTLLETFFNWKYPKTSSHVS